MFRAQEKLLLRKKKCGKRSRPVRERLVNKQYPLFEKETKERGKKSEPHISLRERQIS